MTSEPSMAAAQPRTDSSSKILPSSSRDSTISAIAPTGAVQPASNSASRARSAVTAARVPASSCSARIAANSTLAERHSTAKAPWRRSREHLHGLDILGDEIEQTDTRQAGASEDHGVEFTGFDFAETALQVAPQRHDVEAETECLQLRNTARRRGSHLGTGRELPEDQTVTGDERVTRIFAWRNRRDDETRVLRGR